MLRFKFGRPSGRVVSEADCCAVGFWVRIPEKACHVCKCIVPLWHGGTLNSRRAVSPLVRLVEGEERCVFFCDFSQVFQAIDCYLEIGRMPMPSSIEEFSLTRKT
ncbi:hypothetical protein TNCV_2969351 [Trichonephila clavipes]|nr:hypothetical protein TNCV_2969351 [Trichonephila clavipes]